MTDIYNPYSLICALNNCDLSNYWISSGATSLIPQFISDVELKLMDFEHCYIDKDSLESSDVTDGGAELFLYQSGYLTIKEYTEGIYTLGFPNEEVRKSLFSMVIPTITMRSNSQTISTQSILQKG